jgi:hypothetical protein
MADHLRQNSSSRLTLVLWPSTTMDRLTTWLFIRPSLRTLVSIEAAGLQLLAGFL